MLLGLALAALASAAPDPPADAPPADDPSDEAAPLALPAGAEPVPVDEAPEPGPLPPVLAVGSVLNGTSGNVLVGPEDAVRARIRDTLALTGVPLAAPEAPARFVLNGLVTDQACTRSSEWSGCTWRVRWDVYDRQGEVISLRRHGVGDAGIPQGSVTDGVYQAVIAESVASMSLNGDLAGLIEAAAEEPSRVVRAPEAPDPAERLYPPPVHPDAPRGFSSIPGAPQQLAGGSLVLGGLIGVVVGAGYWQRGNGWADPTGRNRAIGGVVGGTGLIAVFGGSALLASGWRKAQEAPPPRVYATVGPGVATLGGRF